MMCKTKGSKVFILISATKLRGQKFDYTIWNLCEKEKEYKKFRILFWTLTELDKITYIESMYINIEMSKTFYDDYGQSLKSILHTIAWLLCRPSVGCNAHHMAFDPLEFGTEKSERRHRHRGRSLTTLAREGTRLGILEMSTVSSFSLIQAFFDCRDFWFNAVNNSILFSSFLVQ